MIVHNNILKIILIHLHKCIPLYTCISEAANFNLKEYNLKNILYLVSNEHYKIYIPCDNIDIP